MSGMNIDGAWIIDSGVNGTRYTSEITTTKRQRKKSILNKFKQIEFNHDHEISYDTHTLATRVHAQRRHIQMAFFLFNFVFNQNDDKAADVCVCGFVSIHSFGILSTDDSIVTTCFVASGEYGHYRRISSDFSKNSVWIIISRRRRFDDEPKTTTYRNKA